MKKHLIAFVISSLFLVSACDDQVSQKLLETEKKVLQFEVENFTLQERLATAENELQQAKKQLAEFSAMKVEFPALQVEIRKLFDKSERVKFEPSQEQDYTPESGVAGVFVSTAKTNITWLDTLLLKNLISIDMQEDKTEKADPSTKGDVVVVADLTEENVVPFFEKMYQNNLDSLKQDKVLGYTDTILSYYLGQRNHIVTFSQVFSSYFGGAHGIHGTQYLNVDIRKKALISLDDLVSPRNQEKLRELLWQSHVEWRAAKESYSQALQVSKEDFYIPDNFYFTEEGITFVYPVYALASFAEGETKLLVDYHSLKDVVNEEYLPTEKDGFGVSPDF